MKRTNSTLRTLAFCCVLAVCFADGPGHFESSSNVGVKPQKGKVEFDAATGEYRLTGGGANIWAAVDAFQFAWKKTSGDVAFTADVHFIGTGALAHRKATLMIRQSPDPRLCLRRRCSAGVWFDLPTISARRGRCDLGDEARG